MTGLITMNIIKPNESNYFYILYVSHTMRSMLTTQVKEATLCHKSHLTITDPQKRVVFLFIQRALV